MFGRTHEISRLEAFSDAVFAFALTLLVVSLEAPTSYDGLMRMTAGFLPFACSFALLVWIWHEHNMFFRRYGLQDGYTVALNAALLFVVLFYVYPLKFLFTSAFAFFVPALRLESVALSPSQLGRIFLIYSLGYVILFLMFGLLYLHAYRRRAQLNLTPLEIFDVRMAGGAHLVSAGVGVLGCLTVFAPSPLPAFAGFVYFLMGPLHWLYGSRMARRRQAFAARQESAPGVAATTG
jgi:uncharacterized membrane protein